MLVKVTYESNLFDDVDTVDVLATVLREGAVSHHGVLGTRVLIVNANDHRVVVLDALGELEGGEVVDVEGNLSFGDNLVNASSHTDVVDVVLTVGSVEHLRCVVRVLFLSDTKVDTDVGLTEGVVFESDVQFLVRHFL